MKEIIILGSGKCWDKCPMDKEIWAVGKMCMTKNPPPASLWFNMDDMSKMLSFDDTSVHKAPYTKQEMIDKINKTEKPFITSYCIPEIKNCIAYPLKEIAEKYGVLYFTNTIAYMLAYALYKEVDSIELWGVNQAGLLEYERERKGVEFWLGLVVGRGIRVEIKGESQLLQNDFDTLYGYKKKSLELIRDFKIKLQ